MSRLQSLPGPDELCVTLNPATDPARILAAWSTPTRSWTARPSSPSPRSRAGTASGRRSSPGAHLRYGFHEDGLLSALAVAERLGVSVREEAA